MCYRAAKIKYTERHKKGLMISLMNDLEIIFVLIFLYYSQIGIFSMIGSAMVTMATELFCLNKLLENVVFVGSFTC
jgi:hypothetical protein